MGSSESLRLEGTPQQKAAADKSLEQLRDAQFSRRLWERDPSLWNMNGHGAAVAENLGWLTVAEDIADELDSLVEFAEDVRSEGFTHALLLGMGGSSLAAEVLSEVFERREGYLQVRVLDSTDPAAVLAIEDELDIGNVLFVVASKSGETTETASFQAYFYEALRARCDEPGRNFVAITDEGSPLQQQALDQGFRAVFLNPSDIGGRYSALSFFGMVPAALMGLDVHRLVQSASRAGRDCRESDSCPALRLGAALAGLAAQGRDKLTVLADPMLAPFGAWVEQLVAESTGKEGRGILPVDLEPVVDAGEYGDDRVFIVLSIDGAQRGPNEALAGELVAAGHPVLTRRLPDLFALGAAFMEWEIATAAAASLLGVDAFDEPNVHESKENTRVLLEAHTSAGDLPVIVWASMPNGAPGCVKATHPDLLPRALRSLVESVKPHEYVCLQAYLAPSAAVWAGLAAMRRDLNRSLHVATTAGYGPRFLHSTGQFHKGGPRTGVFIQLVADDERDAKIPEQAYSFSVLKRAQADGDLRALRAKGLRALRVELGLDVPGNLALLVSTLRQVLADQERPRDTASRGSQA